MAAFRGVRAVAPKQHQPHVHARQTDGGQFSAVDGSQEFGSALSMHTKYYGVGPNLGNSQRKDLILNNSILSGPHCFFFLLPARHNWAFHALLPVSRTSGKRKGTKRGEKKKKEKKGVRAPCYRIVSYACAISNELPTPGRLPCTCRPPQYAGRWLQKWRGGWNMHPIRHCCLPTPPHPDHCRIKPGKSPSWSTVYRNVVVAWWRR